MGEWFSPLSFLFLCLLIHFSPFQKHYELQLASLNIIHTLLESVEGSRNYSQFVQAFYEDFYPLALPAITNKTPAASLVLRLFTEFEEKHGTNAQFFLLKNNVIPSILEFLHSSNRTLQLCFLFHSDSVIRSLPSILLQLSRILADVVSAILHQTQLSEARRSIRRGARIGGFARDVGLLQSHSNLRKHDE